mgnify:CR=1 FL=1
MLKIRIAEVAFLHTCFERQFLRKYARAWNLFAIQALLTDIIDAVDVYVAVYARIIIQRISIRNARSSSILELFNLPSFTNLIFKPIVYFVDDKWYEDLK